MERVRGDRPLKVNIALNPNQILTKELSPDMKQWEELIRENMFGLGGHRDRLPACLAHMLYCVVAEEQYNLAYFFVKRIECAKATPTTNLPYGMFLTHLYRYVIETYPHLDNGTYDIAERVMRPLALNKLDCLEVIVARHVVPSLLHPLIIKAHHLINTMMMMMMSKLLEQKPKFTIIPPKQLFIDLTNEDTITPSPKLQESSPSAPNAPSKTPSTKDTSSSSIDYTPKSPTSSTSLSPNGYLNPPTSPPPRVSPPPPTQENASMDITLTLSPITPLDVQFDTPSPSPPIFGHPIPWNLLEAHGDSCLCCIHNRTLIFGLRDELQYMFSYIEHMLSQPPTTIIPPPLSSSPN
ncbi:hypothetical protein Tco_0529709 [Tanacetum coccineum]